MAKTVNAVVKRTKKKVVPVKEFVAGQLAFHDPWDDGPGKLVQIRLLETSFAWGSYPGSDAIVMLGDGSLVRVHVRTLRHLPEVFKNATI